MKANQLPSVFPKNYWKRKLSADRLRIQIEDLKFGKELEDMGVLQFNLEHYYSGIDKKTFIERATEMKPQIMAWGWQEKIREHYKKQGYEEG